MANLTSVKPKATSFTAKITIPMNKRIILFASNDFSLWEKKFIEQREKVEDVKAKEGFNTCIKLIKWAKKCEASLETVSNPEGGIEFVFSFTDVDNLIKFIKLEYLGM